MIVKTQNDKFATVGTGFATMAIALTYAMMGLAVGIVLNLGKDILHVLFSFKLNIRKLFVSDERKRKKERKKNC